ncbi:MAG: hypothetical protein ACXAC7_22850 [Candidatus Hodarchaeales archaeon]|jgi:hypothetical protein
MDKIPNFRIIIRQFRPFGHVIAYFGIILLLIFFSRLLSEDINIIIGIALVGCLFVLSEFILTDFYFSFNKKVKLYLKTSSIDLLLLGLKLISYLIIGSIFLHNPPGSPPRFIFPFISSLDYYFILSSWWSAGFLLVCYYLFFPSLNNLSSNNSTKPNETLNTLD